MKIQLKTLIIIFLILLLVSRCQAIFLDCESKQTTKQRHLKRLLKTNKCTNCYLGDAVLRRADLRGADLARSHALCICFFNFQAIAHFLELTFSFLSNC
ncbi:MAG: pentapeptide repeat-containing protein [Pleurocapsa sp.]